MEEFRDIQGYEGLYQVSNLGRVKRLERTLMRSTGASQRISEKILKLKTRKDGYINVMLRKEGEKRRTIKVHQLVAMAFLGHNPNGMKIVVDHKNNIKDDNRVENLQLITNRENCSKDRKGSSKYTGVTWDKKNSKWKAQIQINGTHRNLGRFTCEEEASKKYQKELGKLKSNC